MSRQKRWILNKYNSKSESRLVDAFGVHSLTAKFLIGQGITDPEDAESFLAPALRDMPNPFSLAGMQQAVELAADHLINDRQITVFGDYDVDGIASTSLIVSLLAELEGYVDYVIPHREESGYGLDVNKVEELIDRGTQLLIAVDCGVRANEAIEAAVDADIDVLIIDHHQVPSQLPPADAIVNPQRSDCDYPLAEMSATGIAFNFAIALRSELRDQDFFKPGEEPDLKTFLDLVALGTVADSMPLTGPNRIFVRRGLDLLGTSPRPGIQAMFDVMKNPPEPVTAETIGYQLGPRLNAAGRLADATFCVDLLTTENRREAQRLARRLERLNMERRRLQDEMIGDAMGQAEQQLADEREFLLISDPEWRPGLLGIIAGRVAEHYQLPTAVVGQQFKGSARGVKGLNLFELLAEAEEYFARFGGHEGAAGFTLKDGHKLDELEVQLHEITSRIKENTEFGDDELRIHGTSTVGDIESFARELKYLRPFGVGNPAPSLLLEKITSNWTDIVGKDHLKAEIRDETGSMKLIGFSMSSRQKELDNEASIVATPTRSTFRGTTRTELQLTDIRTTGEKTRVIDEIRELPE